MMRFYNGINKIEISDVPTSYAEEFFNQFKHLSPKVNFNYKFGEAEIEIMFKDRETALSEMKDIKDFFVSMLEELGEAKANYMS